jgi:putative glutamine amidotransferase
MLRLAVSANFFHADPQRPVFRGKTLQYLEARMAASIARAGALPVLVPALPDEETLLAFLDGLDGLVLTGGADVSPLSYGQTPLREAWSGDKVRDDYECRLVRWFIDQRRPVLGLCRGIQLLNVALGGTLWQDIGEQVTGAIVHRDWERYDENGHAVRVEEDSWIARIYGGATRLAVNSIHHQALRDVAPGLRVTAWAPDGIVEAVEWIDDDRFLVAVQWHPEWLEAERVSAGGEADGWADGGAIFQAFAAACTIAARERG